MLGGGGGGSRYPAVLSAEQHKQVAHCLHLSVLVTIKRGVEGGYGGGGGRGGLNA